MTDEDRNRPEWVRYSSLGIEFVAAVLGFTLVGLWFDSHYNCSPWGLVIGAVLGLVGGMYNLIRSSLAAFKRIEQRNRENKEHGPKR